MVPARARAATRRREEIETGFPQMRSDDLAPPTGEFVVARRADDANVLGGCVGLRRLKDASGGAWRSCGGCTCGPSSAGAGLGASLLLCAEEVARVWGVTRCGSTPASTSSRPGRCTCRQGWVEVPAFSDDVYAEVWYAKRADLTLRHATVSSEVLPAPASRTDLQRRRTATPPSRRHQGLGS